MIPKYHNVSSSICFINYVQMLKQEQESDELLYPIISMHFALFSSRMFLSEIPYQTLSFLKSHVMHIPFLTFLNRFNSQFSGTLCSCAEMKIDLAIFKAFFLLIIYIRYSFGQIRTRHDITRDFIFYKKLFIFL